MRAGNAIIYDTGAGGAQEHHIIPKQIKSHPIITESGFDIESPRNKMMLPTGKAALIIMKTQPFTEALIRNTQKMLKQN